MLTRHPLPIGKLYASDLIGAALGCVAVLAGVELLDVPSLILLFAAIGVLAAWSFSAASRRSLAYRWVFGALALIVVVNALGPFSIIEGHAWHRKLLEERGDFYDPVIGARLKGGAKISAADYIDLCQGRAAIAAKADATTAPFDAVAMPTLAWRAPPIASLMSPNGASCVPSPPLAAPST